MQVVGPALRPLDDTSHWTADDNIYDAFGATNIAKLNGVRADTYSWFCNRGGGGVAGIAFVGSLCANTNLNLNERQRNDAASGFVSH